MRQESHLCRRCTLLFVTQSAADQFLGVTNVTRATDRAPSRRRATPDPPARDPPTASHPVGSLGPWPTSPSTAATGRGRFAELRGQDHVVRALRNAVREDRVGHAYLFSGPRGTGKTSSARILAKVLNCERTGRRRAVLRVRLVPRRRGGHQLRRPRARRGQQQRRRGHPRPDREGVARHARPSQGVHPRRGPHALPGRRGRPAEDARGAAAPRRVRARHHRPAEGQPDHPQPHPAPRVPPAAERTSSRRTSAGSPPTPASSVDRRCGRSGRPHGRRLGPRHAVRARPGGRGRRRDAGAGPPRRAGGGLIAADTRPGAGRGRGRRPGRP